MKKIVLIISACLFFTSALNANIRFYPRIIYMDIHKKHNSIYLENSSSTDNIYKLSFSYTRVTEKGKFVKVKEADLTKEDRSFCKNLKVFPRQIKLGAGVKQKVRLTIKQINSNDFNKGEYYCRLYAKALPKPQVLKNNVRGLQTKLNIVISVGAPIHVRANNDIRLDLKIQPYGFRIKNGFFYYKIDLLNKSTMGVRGTLVIDIFNKKTGKKVETFKQGFVNQGKKTSIFLKQKIKNLDLNKNKYEVSVSLFDSPGVDLDFQLFDYHGVSIEKFDLN